ncbi:MAG TPA: hypothetical protein VF665_24555 [Longimicrobium sp.]|jgi:hypothetical protein|uniref:hypothetical protein n=1 Tax=Longimicrobium sp. TaxID=2029185 RepID=UPI002ED88DF8
MEHLAVWAATGLAAKILADVLRRAYGFSTPGRFTSARGGIETDLAYLLAYGIALLVVRSIGLDAALLVAAVLRLAAVVGDRVVLASNHGCLELYLAVVCLQLHHDPVALASVLQVMAVSMWAYAAYQKAYHREYLDGTYFYLGMGHDWRLSTWASRVRRVPKVEGDFGAVDPAARAFCRWMAVLVLIGETVPPILGFALNGTVWGVLLLLAVALPVGLSSSETNFMITNILVALAFLVPFQGGAFRGALNEPLVAVIMALCLVWPPVHAALARYLGVSSWKLVGWGMYAMQKPLVHVVLPGGELVPLRGAIPSRIVLEFGACRLGWVRDAIRRYYFRWDFVQPATGLSFRWIRLEASRYVTRAVVVQNAPGAPARTFDIVDEASAAAFTRHLAALSLAPETAPAVSPSGAVAVAGG